MVYFWNGQYCKCETNQRFEMFVYLSISSFDELLRIFVFGYWSKIIVSNNVFISSIYNSTSRVYHTFGFGGIICDTCFAHRMLTSLDFYHVPLHVTVIYLLYNSCVLFYKCIYIIFLSFM